MALLKLPLPSVLDFPLMFPLMCSFSSQHIGWACVQTGCRTGSRPGPSFYIHGSTLATNIFKDCFLFFLDLGTNVTSEKYLSFLIILNKIATTSPLSFFLSKFCDSFSSSSGYFKSENIYSKQPKNYTIVNIDKPYILFIYQLVDCPFYSRT